MVQLRLVFLVLSIALFATACDEDDGQPPPVDAAATIDGLPPLEP